MKTKNAFYIEDTQIRFGFDPNGDVKGAVKIIKNKGKVINLTADKQDIAS